VALDSWQREHRHGPASSLDPSCRVICLALLSSASLFASAPLAAIIVLSLSSLLKLEGLRFASILRESTFILAFTLFTALLRAFSGTVELISPAAFALECSSYGLKLFAAFLAGRLFYASTSISELRDAATRITRRIPYVRRYDIGLSLSLVLGSIPLILEEWRDSLEAARSRGMAPRPSIAQQSRFLSAFLRRLILSAIVLPQALCARGWSGDRGLTPLRWRKKDSLAALLCCLALIGTTLRLV